MPDCTPPTPDPAWYDQAFGPDYALVYASRDLPQARAEIATLVTRGFQGPFIDLACGAGRHLLAATELGIGGLGIDRSASQTQAARAAGLPVLRADLRALPFRDASFASALSLFSSFGYFDQAGDRAQLFETRRVLRPGGLFFLDVLDPASVRATLVPTTERSLGPCRIHERRWLTPGARRVRKQVQLEQPGRPPRGWTEDLALYEPRELESLLESLGFEVEARWTALTEELAPSSAPRQVLRARRN